jgi:mutator protein MutT
LWEFPGGKCEPGETLPGCLARELREELDVGVDIGAEIYAIVHDYSERSVELHFLRCELIGEPAPLLGQQMQWAARAELRQLAFPPADVKLIELLVDGMI